MELVRFGDYVRLTMIQFITINAFVTEWISCRSRMLLLLC